MKTTQKKPGAFKEVQRFLGGYAAGAYTIMRRWLVAGIRIMPRLPLFRNGQIIAANNAAADAANDAIAGTFTVIEGGHEASTATGVDFMKQWLR